MVKDNRPRILYVCLSAEGVDNALGQLGDADCAELRVDLVKPTPGEMVDLLAKTRKDVDFIVTCRPGVFDEEASLAYLEAAARSGAKYVDVEYERGAEAVSRLKRACAGTGCKVLVSYHNYDKVPPKDELLGVIDTGMAWGADCVKLACHVPDVGANSVLLSLYSERGNIVAFGMGPLGRMSRLASLWCGAEFTYVASDHGAPTAPGQLTLSQMWGAIDALGMCEP